MHRFVGRSPLAQNIRALREARGLTRRQVADQLGKDPQAVYAWEKPTREPSLSDLRRLAEILGVSVADLLAAAPRASRRGVSP